LSYLNLMKHLPAKASWEETAPVCLGFFQILATKSCCGLLNASAFQPASIRIVLVKTVQNQHEHRIGRVITIVGIHRFLNSEPFGSLHLPIISTILRFSPQPDSQIAGQNKAEPNRSLSHFPSAPNLQLLSCSFRF
jgi:hypothetical protein